MKIPFDKQDRDELYKLMDTVFESNMWSGGARTEEFETNFSNEVNMKSATVSNGGAGLLALLSYIDVKGCDVIVPTNTFIATPLAVKYVGGNVVFADCKKEDLCLGTKEILKVITPKTKAVIVVHIGGHLAFDIEDIAELCKKKGIYLIEDCAHAHGAQFNKKCAGEFGIGGSYSFFATKTLPLGEGGMVVSKDPKLIDYVKIFRNYGKSGSNFMEYKYSADGFNYRISEFASCLGIVQLKNLPKILKWKQELAHKYNSVFTNRVYLPNNMTSGYYKYIVFDPIKEYTGPVYNQLCHEIWNMRGDFPNSDWVKKNHYCAPIYYGWEKYNLSVTQLKELLLDKNVTN